MGRRPRIHYPGAVYHVMARGVDGKNIFIDDQDRREFLRALERIRLETNAVIYAYCLMGNHFHLAIKVAMVPLSSIIQRILTGYSLTFNQRYDRTGHLFQARYRSILCTEDRYLLRLIGYIQMNPVRAGLVAAPSDWPWSSRSPVELPDLDADGFNPWPKEDISPTVMRPEIRQALTLDEIGEKVSQMTGVEFCVLRSNSKCRSSIGAKIRFSREGVRCGYRLKVIAAWLGVRPEAVSYYLRKNSTN